MFTMFKVFFHPIAQNCDYMEQMLFLFFCTSDNLIEMVILYFKLQFLPLTTTFASINS